jgi:hypothetical protein
MAQLNDGTVDGTVTIDSNLPTSGTNYANLTDFAAAYNALSGVNANWTVLIESDINQTGNINLAKTVAAGKTVTIKPGVGKTPIINFPGVDNAGFSGQIVIGATSLASLNDVGLLTNNIVIDGSNNGTDSQDLTIRNLNGVVGAHANPRLINIVGNSDNITVKNCIIQNFGNGNNSFCINLQSRTLTGPIFYGPQNITIHNNTLLNTAAGTAGVSGSAGINLTFSNVATPATGAGVSNVTMTSNTIFSRQRGIFINVGTNLTIDQNYIAMNCPSSGFGLGAVQYANAYAGTNGGGPYSLTLTRNTVARMQTVDNATNQSHQAFNLAPGSAGPLGTASITINNNMVGGFNIPSPTSGSSSIRGISIAFLNGSTLTARNNTVVLGPTLPPTSVTTTGLSAAFISPANTLASAAISHNMLYVANGYATSPAALRISGATPVANLTQDFNIFYSAATASPSPVIAQYGASIYGTLAAAQSAVGTLDQNSQEIDFIGSGKATPASIPGLTSGAFIQTAALQPINFRWSSKPVGLKGFDRILLTDIDGNNRSAVASASYPGAHELVSDPLPVAVSAFSLE